MKKIKKNDIVMMKTEDHSGVEVGSLGLVLNSHGKYSLILWDCANGYLKNCSHANIDWVEVVGKV